MLLFGCLQATAAAFAPRLVLLFAWIFGDQVNAVFDTWIMPLLGLIFLPYTTIMYVLVWNPLSGISGQDWLWSALGVMLGIMKWGQMANAPRGIPGYPEEAYWGPAAPVQRSAKWYAEGMNREFVPKWPKHVGIGS